MYYKNKKRPELKDSGEEERHPAKELNSHKHGPLAQGWIAPKFCLYPLELVVQFDKRTLLSKVQLLSHQFLIASKIELFIGDSPDGSGSFETAKYTRLGYIELSSNERTDHKARELKSVHVDAEGTFLKFVLHKNYVNKLNLYNQVGLVAVNVIGMDPQSMNNDELKHYDADPSVIAAINRPDYISPLDDLAFAMYQDPEVSQIIRALDKKKIEMVLAEKYDDAKKLKQAISELYKIGERLARYDIEKRQAIEDEDYEKAKLKKAQMQEYRAETYRQLQNHNLLDYLDSPRQLLRPIEDPPVLIKKTSPLPKLKPSKIDDVQIQSQQQQQELIIQQSLIERAKTPYEDRVIPTLRNNKSRLLESSSRMGDAQIDETNLNTSLNGGISEEMETSVFNGTDPTTDGTEEMTEREVREAAQMNDALGKQVVTKLYSKNFQAREEAIQEAYQKLVEFSGSKDEAKTLMRACAILVAKMIKDNVFSVFNNSLKLLQFMLNDYSRKHTVGKHEITYAVDCCLPNLLQRTGDVNGRLRQRAHDYIVDMAGYAEVKPLHLVPNHCTQPVKPSIAPRLALSRVEIVSDLIKKLGTTNNGLNVDNICKFCSYALEHNSGEVRELASKIIIQMYKDNRQMVRKYLPVDDEISRRNKKYKQLYEAFDKIDGKASVQDDKPIYDIMADRQSKQKGAKIPKTSITSENNLTPRSNRPSTKFLQKSKTPTRSMSTDRKTPISMADESEFNPDNTCIFCGEKNEKFVKEGLELHYWKVCPMLRRCLECKQVIEIAAQCDHLLTECEFKTHYKKCPRCHESVNTQSTQENDMHFKSKSCTQIQDGYTKCPLCHLSIKESEDSWREHLMGNAKDSCTKNSRKPTAATNSNESKNNNIKTKK